jgi:RNA polymerase sigma factor (sigma-70 family)
MIKILIVHPTNLISSLLSSVLDDEKDIHVVGKASTREDALEQIELTQCNIVLVAATLADNDALELTKTVVEKHPEIKVLVIGLPESQRIILQYVMAGASGYVLQEVPVEHLFDNIRAVHEDKAIVSPAIAASFMKQISELAQISSRTNIDPSAYEELTPREREVLDLIGEGMSNQEIADQLYIEVGTVKNHVHNILRKLDVNSREDAAAHLPFIEQEQQEEA